MTWPYDPAIYAYLLNAAAAASFHTHYQTLTLPPSHRPPSLMSSPWVYYASMGLQRAAAAYTSQTSNVELFSNSSSGTDHKSLGVSSTSPASPTGPPALIAHSVSDQGHGGQGHGASGKVCACAACCPTISGLQQTAASASTGLFQPYKSDVESSAKNY